MKTLHSFCRDNKFPKTSVRRFLLGQGFDTSEGLTPAAESAALAKFGASAPNPEALTKLPTHSTEILPSEHGKRFDMGQNYELHLHVHTTNADEYCDRESMTDRNIQSLLDRALSVRFQQGQEDQAEVDAVISAAKSKLIEAGVAGLVVKGKPEDPQKKPEDSQSSLPSQQ